MLEAKPAQPTAATTAQAAPSAPAAGAPATPAHSGQTRPHAGHTGIVAADGDQLGPLLARAVARRAEFAEALLQRVPSSNKDPTRRADGLYWDRRETTDQNGQTVPERITAIMRNPGVGTVPSIVPPGWEWLEQHVERLKGNWVRFHIINRLLGGSGHSALNLVPTSVAVNNAFSRGIETDAKRNVDNGEWTFIDVELTYDGSWPAPIPKFISAEQGTWDEDNEEWVALTKQNPGLVNFDITQLDGGPIYLRGDNITAKQIELRGASTVQAGRFAKWLRTYSQPNGSDYIFLSAVDDADFDADLLREIWLDEDEARPGQFTPVVKKLAPRVAPTKPGKPTPLVGIEKKRHVTSTSSKKKHKKHKTVKDNGT